MIPLEPIAGTWVNLAGILLGGVLGCLGTSSLPASLQQTAKSFIGMGLIGFGFYLAWQHLPDGFWPSFKMLVLVSVSLSLGKALGQRLHIQRGSNRLGQTASKLMEKVSSTGNKRFQEGLLTCSILFCIAPLALLGPVQNGLNGGVSALGIKAVIDGLSMMAFAALFGVSVLTVIIPVLAFQGTLTLLIRASEPWLTSHHLTSPILVTTGLLMTFVAVLVFDVKKVPVADYLPALAIAPVLFWIVQRFIG